MVELNLFNNFKNLGLGVQGEMDKIFEVVEVKVRELRFKVESCCNCNNCNYCKWFNIVSESF